MYFQEMIQEKIEDEEVFRAKKAVMEANREQRQKPKNTSKYQSREDTHPHDTEVFQNNNQGKYSPRNENLDLLVRIKFLN